MQQPKKLAREYSLTPLIQFKEKQLNQIMLRERAKSLIRGDRDNTKTLNNKLEYHRLMLSN